MATPDRGRRGGRGDRGGGGGRGDHGGGRGDRGGGGGRGGRGGTLIPPGAVYGRRDSLGHAITNFPPTVTQQKLDESIDRITNVRNPDMQAHHTQFELLPTPDSRGVRHLYIWPNLPTPATYDPNDSSDFWGLGDDPLKGGSHVHIIVAVSGPRGRPQLQISNGVMTVNRGSIGRQNGTEIWHLKIQFPPIQPHDVVALSDDLKEHSMNASHRNHPPHDPENQWTPIKNNYMDLDRLNASGVRRLMNDRILMDAVQYHVKHDTGFFQDQWKSLALPRERKWTQRGRNYRDQWQRLMYAVSWMGTHWWGDPYAFPVKNTQHEKLLFQPWTRDPSAEVAPVLPPPPAAQPAPTQTREEAFPELSATPAPRRPRQGQGTAPMTTT